MEFVIRHFIYVSYELEVREMKECTIICNTRWGYCMTPKKCKSIAEAIRYAKEMEMAFRIFVNGK